ncbi:hypothetical protein COU38_00985 [Candidatus Micrarchaeota archaeon CG10_big_fil_rev_8_21_14_0_10_54_18]|nr:MAG: hypothetical protein COU38_00985 [Candidatus Micrarchaeota archaeon CG10_big_fil_rev_8_21_14_0_10_54_18]
MYNEMRRPAIPPSVLMTMPRKGTNAAASIRMLIAIPANTGRRITFQYSPSFLLPIFLSMNLAN